MIHVSSISVSDKYANSLTYEVCEKTKSRGPEGPLDSHSNIFSLFPIFLLKKITLICVWSEGIFGFLFFSRYLTFIYGWSGGRQFPQRPKGLGEDICTRAEIALLAVWGW